VMNGLMAIPNLIGLLLLSGVVASESRRFLGQERKSREAIRAGKNGRS
jgi:alanine or glycine:cation symporter, AGCS family